MQSLLVKAQGAEEKFDSSLPNHVAGVQKSDTLDFLEELSHFRSDPFTIIDQVLSTNSYMIACTNTQSFVEEGEHSTSAISAAHLEPLFLILEYDINLIGLNFKFQGPPIMLVVVLINFGVKNQATQVLFQNSIVGDSM